MVPNYIIPSEYEMLEIISINTGIGVVWDINAKNLIEENKIQLLWNSKQMPSTEVFVLSGKNDNLSTDFRKYSTGIEKGFGIITSYKSYYDQYIPKLLQAIKAVHFSLF